jgi:anti-anti-sigma factor
MHISRTARAGALHVAVTGRLDGYWADHLDSALAEAVREGHHHLRVDLAQVTFLSSAGIAVLMKVYKQLGRINGSLAVLNPSPPVRVVLDMTRLSALLIAPDAPQAVSGGTTRTGRCIEHAGAAFEVFDLLDGRGLHCRVVGRDAGLLTGAFGDEDCVSLDSLAPLFAIGVGAFGEGFADCRARFGELLSVTGATGYQPADGTNVPDYLVSSGHLASDVRVLYCLACEGSFTQLARFESPPGGTVSLLGLAESCLAITRAPAAGFVAIGEAAGLVGAALRRSPAQPDEDFFAHPGIRRRLTFTAERAFLRSLTLTAGVVMRGDAAHDPPQLRPLGTGGLLGHVHAAAFPFRPLRKGEINLKDTVTSLFEHEQLLGVLHLLHDDRGAAGAGDSEFIRGACWVGPIVGDWLAGPAG